MEKEKLKIFYSTLKSIGQLASLLRLYDISHHVIQETGQRVFAEVTKFISENQSFSMAASGGIFLINGQELEAKDSLTKKLIDSFHSLKLGALELEPGLTIEEFFAFMTVASNKEHMQGEEQIKKYLAEKNTKHIIARLAEYKLVQENEEVAKKGSTVKIEDMPKEVVDKFIADFKGGQIGTSLKSGEKAYQFLSHDPVFLSGMALDLVKNNDTPDEMMRILWAIGDYLLEEIGNFRQEEVNRKILDELKNRLISHWEEKKEKEHWKKDIEKSFVAIDAALTLKGSVLLYEKHKKEIEHVAKKIKTVLESLPEDSLIYKKTLNMLARIGLPDLDPVLFKESEKHGGGSV